MFSKISYTDYVNAIKQLNNRLNQLIPLSLDYVEESPESKEPFCCSGNFSIVFKVKDKLSNYYAIKCFTKECTDRLYRYKTISDYLEKLNSEYFVKYEYLEDEIYITRIKKDFPVLKMSWVEGRTLGETIKEACKTKDLDTFKTIYEKWDNLCKFLLENFIAHGDLKHDNIIVTPDNSLVLIDYDGMYIPALKDLKSIELGGPAYQHPQRNQAVFNEKLDHFSMLVIKLSLYALIKKPDLFPKYHTSENIIFSKKDFINTQNSPLILEIQEINDPYLNRLLEELKKSCISSSIALPNILEILYSEHIRPLENLMLCSQNDHLSSINITLNNLNKRVDELTKQQIIMNNALNKLTQIANFQQTSDVDTDKTIIEKLSKKSKEKYMRISKFWTNFLPEKPTKKDKKYFQKLMQSIRGDLKSVESKMICDENNDYWSFSEEEINHQLDEIIINHIFNFFEIKFDKVLKYHKELNSKYSRTNQLQKEKFRLMKEFGFNKIPIVTGEDVFSSDLHEEFGQENVSSKKDGVILEVVTDGYQYRDTGIVLKKAIITLDYRP